MDDRYYYSDGSDTTSIDSTRSATSSDPEATSSSANTMRFAAPLHSAVHHPVSSDHNAFSIDTPPSLEPISYRFAVGIDRFFRSRRVRGIIIWTLLAMLGVFQLIIFGITIWFLKLSANGSDPGSLEFAMYKNSGFKDCAASSAPYINCTILNTYDFYGVQGSHRFQPWSLEHNGSFLNDLHYNQYSDPRNSSYNVSYTWCELASCLKGFKVIPSSPYPSAFTFSIITLWSFVNLLTISGLWSVRKRIFDKAHSPEDCKRQGILDWFFQAYDLCSFIIWWREFGLMIEQPYHASVISIMAWFTPFRYAFNLNAHPYSCWLTSRPKLKKVLILTFCLVTFIQWIATVHFIRLRVGDIVPYSWPSNLYRKYDCLQSQISNATGTSVCSPEQLCAKDWLFSDIGFGWENDVPTTGVPILYFVGFIVLMLLIILTILKPVGWWVLATMDGKEKTWRKAREKFLFAVNLFIPLYFCFLPIFAFFINILLTCFVTTSWKAWDRSATVNYDLECRAVHVAISPWLQYLDVPNHGWEQRIVKMWFNS